MTGEPLPPWPQPDGFVNHVISCVPTMSGGYEVMICTTTEVTAEVGEPPLPLPVLPETGTAGTLAGIALVVALVGTALTIAGRR